MRVGGYDFPEINLTLPAGAIVYPHIYTPDEAGYGARFNIQFSADLLPPAIVEDIAGNGIKKTNLARAKSGSAPRVDCADMRWLVELLEETAAANQRADNIFRTQAVRVNLAPIPVRWIAGSRTNFVELDESAVALLFDSIEVIKP